MFPPHGDGKYIDMFERVLYNGTNLYVGNHADVRLGNRTVKIVPDTSYPWDGDVSLRLEPERSGARRSCGRGSVPTC